MTVHTRAVLDACVLIPMPLADTLLRLAEEPRLYIPMWSEQILDEVSRNLLGPPWHLRQTAVERRRKNINQAFPSSLVVADARLTARMKNDPKDRHVLATAVTGQAQIIVTYDRTGFLQQALDPWAVRAVGPSAFLKMLYRQNPGVVRNKLEQQAADLRFRLPVLVEKLRANVPAFAEMISGEGWVRAT